MLATLLPVLALACDGDVSTPTGPTIVTLTTETFAGSLAVGATRFYSFTVTAGGTVTASLASVTSPQDGTALGTMLELGIGVPAGTGCSVTTTRTVSPALTAQVLTSSTPGVRCVRVADVGDLTAPVRFAVRFVHP